jgi:ABC-type amino acid transport system permease subunit
MRARRELLGLLVVNLAEATTGAFGLIILLGSFGLLDGSEVKPRWAALLFGTAFLIAAFGSIIRTALKGSRHE